MQTPPLPADEAPRLAALRRLNLLDTPPEARFDRITRLAMRLFDVPIALISLVDAERQWFKSCQGLSVRETPRAVSFCDHAICQRETFVVPDAAADPRFADSPLVLGPPHARFYAGHPLRTPDGSHVGTLCLMDRRPRTLCAADLVLFGDLAAVAQDELTVVQGAELSKEAGQRRRAEEELQRAMHAAEAANRAKTEFLANMSHELRTPLNSVIGFANILLKNKAGNLLPLDLTYLTRIQESGKHLLGLINQVLDLAKVEAGRMELELELAPVALDALIRATVAQLEDQILSRDVEVVLELPAALAPLEADAGKLKQVLINLLDNALKFTERGEIRVRVTAGPRSRVPVCIEVRDTGIGIARDKLETVFLAFRQADSSTARRYGGTGLGLTIARSLCELMGYRIEAASEVGKGSTFRVHFPAEGSRRDRWTGFTVAPARQAEGNDLAEELRRVLRETLQKQAGPRGA